MDSTTEPQSYWKNIQVFHSGDEYYDSMIQQIQKAEKSIYIESYIFQYDSLTKAIINELEQAKVRGCNIKILVDGAGSYFDLPLIKSELLKRKIEFRVFREIPGTKKIIKNILSQSISRIIKLIFYFNKRTHRKLTLIDGKIAYLGSLNFTEVHCEKYLGPYAWRDSGVCITDGSIQDLVRAFNISWTKSRIIKSPIILTYQVGDRDYKPEQSLVRLNSKFSHRKKLHKELLNKINSAQKEIFLTTAYFLPRRSLLKALKAASQRGVLIRVITPGKSDIAATKWASYYLIKALLMNGVRIFEYHKTILHAKYLIIDDWLSVGSHNFNHRSFFHDLEIEATFTDSETINSFKDQWFIDKVNSTPIDIDVYKQKNFVKRFVYWIFFKVRYFM